MLETIRTLHKRLDPMYGHGEAEAMIRIIFHYLKGWSVTDMLIHDDSELSPYIKGEIASITDRLLLGEPIQYITGEAPFHGLNLHVDPSVLIPRPETSMLVDIICDANKRPDLRVLDIGTGSGCIAIALARTLPFATVSALDISGDALRVARRNATDLKVKLDFIEADMSDYHPGRDSLDIVVSNPPYVLESEKSAMEVNVLEHEPPSALFVPDSDPLVFYRSVARIAHEGLTDGGRLYLEINPLLARETSALVESHGFGSVDVIKDQFGKDRFITAIKTGE